MQVAWFQLLVSSVKLLPPADFQLFEPTFRIRMLTSVGCFGGSRPTGPVLELFRKLGAVRSSTQKTCTYIGHTCRKGTHRGELPRFHKRSLYIEQRLPLLDGWRSMCRRASLLAIAYAWFRLQFYVGMRMRV